MRGAKNLQSEVEKLVLATANPADALRELAELLCKRTRSKLALVAHFEDEERGATLLAHPGLSAANANTFC